MKKIVVVGGGSGIFNVLKGLKKEEVELVSIVTTFDDGGSTGMLRDEFGTLPSGDIRRSLLALSSDEQDHVLRELFLHRFPEESSLKGHSFGNLFIKALLDIGDDPVDAINKAGKLLNIKGVVIPVSLDDSRLCAKLENGDIIKGETNIDIPKHDGNVKISKVFLKPDARLSVAAWQHLLKADLVIFGPGDLYTSIIPNILTEGFIERLNQSRAKVLYVSNIMTKWGETDNFKASDFAMELLKYLKRDKLDYILCDNTAFTSDILEKYISEKSKPVMIDSDKLKTLANKVMVRDLVTVDEIIRHDADKLRKVIMEIV